MLQILLDFWNQGARWWFWWTETCSILLCSIKMLCFISFVFQF